MIFSYRLNDEVKMMSEAEYEDYSSKFGDFDKMRATPAWPSIKEAINMASEQTLGLPVGELVVLDAGCGTGLYTDKVKDIVKQVHFTLSLGHFTSGRFLLFPTVYCTYMFAF